MGKSNYEPVFIMLDDVAQKALPMDGDPFGLEPVKEIIESMLKGTDHFCEIMLADLARRELKHEGLALFVNEQMSAAKYDEFTLMATHNVPRSVIVDVGKDFTFPVSSNGMTMLESPDVPFWDFFLGLREKTHNNKPGRIFAVLAISNTETDPSEFQPEHWAVINVLGKYLAWMFAQKGFIDHLSLEDEKTGAWNARWFKRKMNDLEQLRMEERLGNLTFVFLDVDGYKKVNDENGHVFADLAMGHMFHQLRRCFKKTDYIARWGKGDEWVIICLDVSSQDILRRFKGMNHEDGLHIKAAGWQFFHDGKQIDGFEMSVGIAQFDPAKDGILKKAMQRADDLQGLVKKTGKFAVLADHETIEIQRRIGELKISEK